MNTMKPFILSILATAFLLPAFAEGKNGPLPYQTMGAPVTP